MGTKVKKWLKTALCGAGVLVLLMLSGFLGTRIERNRQKSLELQKEQVSTIAVVNMDNGVRVGNEQVNYASQLMGFPNDHFLVTGLTDAKAGIDNGIYAAYVVIPETFSESVTSIENDPRKVILVYQYNNKLVEEAEIQAVNDINAFTVLLNSNIAYMYVDAIMEEFHRIQDDSSTILANDNMELELLTGVNAAKLIAVAEPVEDISVNNEIQPVELTTYIARNSDLLSHMLSGYSEAAQKGKDEYTVIQEENTEVEEAINSFLLAYDTAIQDTVMEQSRFLLEGREELAEAVGLYNQTVHAQEAEMKIMVADIMNAQLEADRKSAESQLQKILDDYNDAFIELQQQWGKVYQDLQSEVDKKLAQSSEQCCDSLSELVKEVYVQGYIMALEDMSAQINSLKEDASSESISADVLQEAIHETMSGGSLTPEAEADIEEFKTVVREQLCGISIDWSQSEIKLPEVPESGSDGNGTDDGENPDDIKIALAAVNDEIVISGMVRAILDSFEMESESEQINDVIQTYFVDALSEEGERQMSSLSDEKLQLSQSMETYEERLIHYNPLQYIENANLDTYLNDIEANAREMLGVVEQSNSDYMLYATAMYTNTTEHTTQVRSSLDKANVQTAENVTDCIGDLISSREAVNSQNVSLLEGFTDSLRYTRVESQRNAVVYDYIVNPVASQINGQAITNTVKPTVKKDNSMKIWLVVVLGIGIMFCMAEVIINFRQQYKKTAEEREDAL